MKDWALGTILFVCLLLIVGMVSALHSRDQVRAAEAAILSTQAGENVLPASSYVAPSAKSVASPEKVAKEEVAAPTLAPAGDPLASELTTLMGTFVPSYPDHEPADALASRRAQIAEQIADAARAEFPEASTARKYAVLLTFIGQRESRFALAVQKLGSQDNGAAHGAWQIHAWKGENPYLATTAMNMLHEAPDSWALPKGEPWRGYPKAEAYLEAHP